MLFVHEGESYIFRAHTRWVVPLQVGLDAYSARPGGGGGTSAEFWMVKMPRTKLHKCSFCDYTTMYSTGLTRHLRTHTGDKPFSCPHCQYSTITQYHLNRHIRIHNG